MSDDKNGQTDLLNAGKDRSRENRTATRSTEEERPQRPRADRSGKLSIPRQFIKPGYVPYLAIDKPGNIESMTADGWEFIYASSATGERTSDEQSQTGTKYTIPAGGGFTYFGLQIRQEWYAEIQQERLEQTRQSEEAMKRPDMTNIPTAGDAYIPSSGGFTSTIKDYNR